MVYAVPLTYTVRRTFKAKGETFEPGHVMTAVEVEGLNLSVLVSSGRLEAAPDVHHRLAAGTDAFQPTYIHPDAYKDAITP